MRDNGDEVTKISDKARTTAVRRGHPGSTMDDVGRPVHFGCLASGSPPSTSDVISRVGNPTS